MNFSDEMFASHSSLYVPHKEGVGRVSGHSRWGEQDFEWKLTWKSDVTKHLATCTTASRQNISHHLNASEFIKHLKSV